MLKTVPTKCELDFSPTVHQIPCKSNSKVNLSGTVNPLQVAWAYFPYPFPASHTGTEKTPTTPTPTSEPYSLVNNTPVLYINTLAPNSSVWRGEFIISDTITGLDCTRNIHIISVFILKTIIEIQSWLLCYNFPLPSLKRCLHYR